MGNRIAAGGFETLVLGHAMNQLQQNAARAAGQSLPIAHPYPVAPLLPSLGTADVMEPFAATKAFYGRDRKSVV